MSTDEILFAATLSQSLPTVDLHTLGSSLQLESVLHSELYAVYQSGAPVCRIIHGVGTGTLSNLVRKELSSNPIVTKWQAEDSGGSVLVAFA